MPLRPPAIHVSQSCAPSFVELYGGYGEAWRGVDSPNARMGHAAIAF